MPPTIWGDPSTIARCKPVTRSWSIDPGGAYRPDADADWHLLVGDESALPSNTAALDALAPETIARVLLQVDQPGQEPQLTVRDGVEVTYVHRNGDGDGRLLTALETVTLPEGVVHAFVHGEAQEVMHEVRPYLLTERGLPRSRVSLSGYRRRGRTEDSFRVWK